MIFRKEIEGLRAVAVIPVVLWHAGFPFVSGGYIGVDVFFVISGFLITSILLKEMSEGKYSILRFYERRARRILPALMLILCVSYSFAWIWLIPTDFENFSRSAFATLVFASNFHFWLFTSYFSAAADQTPLLHTWSLAVEEQFYIIFPPLLFLFWKQFRKYILLILAVMAVSSFVMAEIFRPTAPDMAFFLAPTRAWELIIGSIVAVLYDRRRNDLHLSKGQEAVAALGLAMVFIPIFIYDEVTPNPSLFTLIPVLGTSLVLLWARENSLTAGILSLAPLRWIGLISYSAYLWHQPIFAFFRIRWATEPSLPMMAALCILTLALAFLTWYFVEQPIRKTGQSAAITTRQFAIVFSGCTALLLSVSVLGIVSKGADFRLPPEVRTMSDRFSAAHEGRLEIVRVGKCQHNEIKTGIDIEEFIETWSCRSKTGEAHVASLVAIFGDSHAADIAGSVRLNGYDISQIGGASCSLAPEYMTDDCRRLAEFAKKEIMVSGVSELWLANRFDRSEATFSALQNIVDFWAIPGVHVTLFTPMPEFRDMKNQMISSIWRGTYLDLQAENKVAEVFLSQEAQDLFSKGKVRLIDSGMIFCATAGPKCQPFDGDSLLMIDGHHLSPEGQARFGLTVLSRIGPLPIANAH